MEQVEDEDAMYAQLLKQPVDTDNRPTKPSSGSKVHAKQNVQVLNVGLLLLLILIQMW